MTRAGAVCTSPNRILFTLPSSFPVSSTSSASTSWSITRFWTDPGRFPTVEAVLLFCVRHVSVRRFWLWPSSREWLFTTAFPVVSRSPEGPEEGWPFPDTRAWDPSREESLGCNFKPFQREKSYFTMFGFTEYDILIGYSLTTEKIGTQGNRYVVNNKHCMKTETRTKEKQHSKLSCSQRLPHTFQNI